MTAKEFIKGCEHDGSYIPVGEVLRLMKEYAKLMCDKQKEICAEQADTKRIGHGYQTYDIIDTKSIINSPYPEELL